MTLDMDDHEHIAVQQMYHEQKKSRSHQDSSSAASSSSEVFDENSSLGVLDFDTLPDARKSVSLIHVNSKCSSIGSWLDNCFSGAETETNGDKHAVPSNMQQLYRSDAFDLEASDVLSASEMQKFTNEPLMGDVKDESDDSNNSFEFNEDELSIHILANDEEDDKLNDTITAPEEHEEQQNHSKAESKLIVSDPGTNYDPSPTTFDFLKGLGLAVTQPSQSFPESPAPSGKNSEKPIERWTPMDKFRLDSCYFAATSMRSLDGTLYDDTHNYSDAVTSARRSTVFGSKDGCGEDVSDGKSTPRFTPVPQHSSTVKAESSDHWQDTDKSDIQFTPPASQHALELKGSAFDDWQCNAPLDFSGMEFRNDSNLQQDMFGDEQFAQADDVMHMLDNEEELFQRENQFMLDDNFVADSNNDATGHGFSTCRSSAITVQGEDAGKISIGTYMAKRSEKLGDLDAHDDKDRPSFGLKFKTPSPQKPCQLVANGSTLATIQDVSSSSSSSSDGSKSNVDQTNNASNVDVEEQLLSLKLDDTVDASMMTSISKAISDLSSTMNNEELAKFIIALSNQKLEAKKRAKKNQATFTVFSSDEPSSAMSYNSGMDIDRPHTSRTENTSSSNTQASNDDMDSTLKNDTDQASYQSKSQTLSPRQLSRATSTSLLNYAAGPGGAKKEESTVMVGSDDELPPLPNDTVFSPRSVASRILSSTRASLSLRGSLSRDSIEQLHKKLRAHSDKREVELPDVFDPPQSNKATAMSTKTPSPASSEYSHLSSLDKDVLRKSESSSSADISSRESVGPLSQSSPDSAEAAKTVKFSQGDLSRLSAAFQHLHPSSSFNELATLAESEFETQQAPVSRENSGKEFVKTDFTVKKDSRGSFDSVSAKYELPSVDGAPKASSTRTSDSDFNRTNQSSRSVADNMSSALSLSGNSFPSRLNPDGSFPSFSSVPNVLPQRSVMPQRNYISTDPHFYHPMSSSHPLMQVVPSTLQPLSIAGHTFVGAARTFDSSVHTSRSYPSNYNYPHVLPYPSHPGQTVIPMQNAGSYPSLPDPYYESADVPTVNHPHELTFDNSLCVGVPSKVVLTLKNNSARWIQVELRTMSVTVNRQPAPLSNETYVTLKLKHVIGPRGVEHTDITMTGQEPGQCAAVIEVTCHLIGVEGDRSPQCNRTTVNVTAVCETPLVSVFASPDIQPQSLKGRLVNFGELVCGSSKSLPVRILNKSKVEIPVRLVLFTSSQDRSCFSLSFSSTNTNQRDRSNVGSMSVLRTILAVGDQPFTIWLHFDSPMRRFVNGEDPVKVEGRIEVVLDAPFKSSDTSMNMTQTQTLLDAVGISAIVGVGKLHAPRSRQMLSFVAARGAVDVKQIPVKNAGNISVQVAFSLESHRDIFTLTPSTAVLSPGGNIELTVEFKPTQTTPITTKNEPFDNLIFMNILPSGPQFEVRLTATVSGASASVSESAKAAPPTLLTNKTRLRWGGVSIGKSRKQKLMLRSGSNKTAVTFRCSIKADDTSSFQIITTSRGTEELSTHCDMSIAPGQDQSIYVLFSPTRKKMVHAKMEIKTPIDELPSTKFTIPLSGYGCVGMIKVDGLDLNDKPIKRLHNDYLPESYVMPCSNQVNELKISNCGNRWAFVKVAIYSDISCERSSSDFLCAPTQFVLQERQSRTLHVKSKSGCGSSSGYVSIWHGDELARLLLKKALANHNSASSLVAKCVPQTHAYLRSISFDGIFDGEDGSAEEDLTSIEPHSYDVQLFFTNIKQTLIELKPISSVPLPAVPTHSQANLSCQDLPERDVGLIEDTTQNQEKLRLSTLPSCKPTSFSPNWDVTPTHVTLTLPPTKGPSSYSLPELVRVKIKNHSMASLTYDIVWPGHYLTITPNRGRVEPESIAVLLISANPSLASSKDLLPWCGQAMVLATGGGPGGADNSRTIYVQIKEVPEALQEKALKHDEEGAAEVEVVETQILPKLVLSANPVEFESITIGNSSKSYLEFRNMSKTSVKWILASIGPSYVKNPETGDIFKSTYAAFVFPHKSGLLEPGARVQLPVTFNPMNVGTYIQHWEIEYYKDGDDAAISLQKEKVQLQGQGLKPQSNRSHSSQSLSDCNNDISVSEECYWFPDTVVSKSSVIKVPIKNKGKTAHTVKFINLRSPFHITHQKYSIRSMCCANLPVTFKPSQNGAFVGTLVIQTEQSQEDIRVVMKAKAVTG